MDTEGTIGQSTVGGVVGRRRNVGINPITAVKRTVRPKADRQHPAQLPSLCGAGRMNAGCPLLAKPAVRQIAFGRQQSPIPGTLDYPIRTIGKRQLLGRAYSYWDDRI